MGAKLLHIFRNTPLGRETLFQSAYFCKQTGTSLVIYVPRFKKFLMYFAHDAVQVDLDDSYLFSPETAVNHAVEIVSQLGVTGEFIEIEAFTASTLPDVPSNFDFMCSPRSVSDKAAKIGLGHIGSRVRRIVCRAGFPVLISSPVFKPWNHIVVFFGGSANSVNALKVGLRLARKTGIKLQVFTQIEASRTEKDYKNIAAEAKLEKTAARHIGAWNFFSDHLFDHHLYDIPHDALVILGAYGHGVIKDILFGSKMEITQSSLPNNLLVVGPNYTQIHR